MFALSICPILAIDFNAIIDPSLLFNQPAYNGNFYPTAKIVSIQLQMANNDDIEWCAYSMPLRFYGTGDLSIIDWADAGGDPEPSIIRKNGFEVGGIWTAMNSIFTWSWNGLLPDTMNHTVVSCVGSTSYGWSADMNELLTRLEFYFVVSLGNGDTGSVCIDSVGNHSDSRYDWLFMVAQDFGGPFCFPFANSACGDINLDGTINILDVVFLINYKYKGGPTPTRLDLSDVNNDNQINILDVVYIINYKYKGGPLPNCPQP